MINTIKKIYRKKSIKQKLLLLFSVQIIIPIIFIGIMLYKNTYKMIQDKSISYSIDLLKMIKLRINDFSNEMVNISQDIIYDTKLYETLRGQVNGKRSDSDESIEYTYNLLSKICLSKKGVQSIALISTQGRTYSYDLNAGRTNIREMLPYKKLLIEARKGAGSVRWYCDSDKDGNLTNLYLARMIYDVDSLKELGLMAILIDREQLKTVYSDLSISFMQNVNILSPDNKWIMGTQEDWGTSDQVQFIKENTKEWDYIVNKEEKYLLTYMCAEDTGWKIVTEASLDKLINNELKSFRNKFIILTIVTILVLSVFSILMAIDFINPIKRLVASIIRVKEENVHQEVVVDREDELGYLSECFNNMTQEIDRLLNEVYKEKLTRREAELKALQAQINPHFLFNTLESINWMAQLNNVPEIRDMVTSLGALMEASIGKGNPMIPLSKELKYVDSYILIMKNRYGDRLIYDSEIDQTVLNAKVPKLLLQPLVENAIYHGIDRKRNKGIIKLVIRKIRENISIEVIDNGRGITPEEVQILNEKFTNERDELILGEGHKGIGLMNVNERIKLFFGSEYGLSIESEYEMYTKLKINIPINK